MRSLFREGRGINSSIAIYQDVTGKAEEKTIALGVAIGSGYLYKTTFEKEVFSDLYGGKKFRYQLFRLWLQLRPKDILQEHLSSISYSSMFTVSLKHASRD